MPLSSDITVNAAKIDPEKESEASRGFNQKIIAAFEGAPKWWEVGPKKYREMRWNGQGAFPKPVVLDYGIDTTIPSRDAGRQIPCRIIKPQKSESKGVFLHIHGGGWVLGDEKSQDVLLAAIAEETSLSVVSVGYRLAPENPFPAGPNDCYDVAEYLVDNSVKDFGGELMFVGGESAGGQLSALVCLHLLETRPAFSFRGLVLHYGCFDCAGLLPFARHFKEKLILHEEVIHKFIEAFAPGTTEADRRSPEISPFFADLRPHRGRLPPALFTVGTRDALLDDSLMMGVKWQAAGAEGIVRIYEGGAHGFTLFPLEVSELSKQAMDDTCTFIKDRTP